MDLEKIKKYLQVYLDEVVTPKINRELVGEEDEQITMIIYDILKGSYQPPIIHIFIDIDPNWKGSITNKLENEILRFMEMFSIPSKIKVHLNKRPAFKPK